MGKINGTTTKKKKDLVIAIVKLKTHTKKCGRIIRKHRKRIYYYYYSVIRKQKVTKQQKQNLDQPKNTPVKYLPKTREKKIEKIRIFD